MRLPDGYTIEPGWVLEGKWQWVWVARFNGTPIGHSLIRETCEALCLNHDTRRQVGGRTVDDALSDAREVMARVLTNGELQPKDDLKKLAGALICIEEHLAATGELPKEWRESLKTDA